MEKRNIKIKENIRKLLLRLELWFAPLLIIVPLAISLFFVQDWYIRGFSTSSSEFNGELLIGLLILFGNVLVDIPFLRSIRLLRKKE
ncbi:hypothetical protein AYK25_03555 [Thermoplasmatales archaeon SM1-50]|nr:MAG: hypothetical protein AYK25_03555 [Thermoplasmatales archaeon SM1-50]